jgi:psiF repeat-containing protein
MRIKPLIAIGALALSVSGAALAFDAAAPDASGAPAAKPSAGSSAAGRSAKSIECSQKADAQNLHGRPRKHFMHECKHGA